MRICALRICQKEVDPGEPYQMIGIDKPYYNVFFHRTCFERLEKRIGWEGIGLYLAKTFNLWYNRDEKHGKRRRKRKKISK